MTLNRMTQRHGNHHNEVLQNDTQHNGNHHNDIQQNDTKQNEIQKNKQNGAHQNGIQKNEIQDMALSIITFNKMTQQIGTEWYILAIIMLKLSRKAFNKMPRSRLPINIMALIFMSFNKMLLRRRTPIVVQENDTQHNDN